MNSIKKVLYADDDLDDKAWVSEACKSMASPMYIDFVENGKQVLAYLANCNEDSKPAAIILDLNMPTLDGRQTLQRLKAMPEFKDIPVIIVTTSASKIDMEMCKRLGAAMYLTKPDTYTGWQQILKQLEPLVID
ncbi:response regulator [Chitinophagaceae bacterium LB-8]|uniref:Response regulator n=1 Tax=Paraflavisolibacter caeni TaxID=2982496 RepID=A0A9X3BF09_9BACT|nr:response regulator [Paraflavisolibacter caeni]MCU7548049.1 response regulator [Paraflavisolibacter caeni]